MLAFHLLQHLYALQYLRQWHVAKMWTSRATISRHVNPSDSSCGSRMLQWIDNFECLIVTFPGICLHFIISFNDTLSVIYFVVYVRSNLMLTAHDFFKFAIFVFASSCCLVHCLLLILFSNEMRFIFAFALFLLLNKQTDCKLIQINTLLTRFSLVVRISNASTS
jgi:hypothetical protein